MMEDKNHNVWLISWGNVSKISPNFNGIHFIPYDDEFSDGTSSEIRVHTLFEDSRGNIWLGDRHYGSTFFNPNSNHFTSFSFEDMVWQFEEDSQGRVWIGAFNGLRYYDPVTNQVQTAWGNLHPERENLRVDAFTLDHHGHIWIGSESKLLQFDQEQGTLLNEYVSDLTDPNGTNIKWLNSIQVDIYGNLWLGGEGGGLQWFNPKTSVFKSPLFPTEVPAHMASAHYPLFLVDSNGSIWASLDNTFTRFSYDSLGNITQMDRWENEMGFISEHSAGKVWLANHEKKIICLYSATEGKLITHSFQGVTKHLDGSILATKSGEIYMGNYYGLIRFHPDSLKLNKHSPNIVLTDFNIANQYVPIRGTEEDSAGTSPLTQSITYTQHIQLTHTQNNFTIEFAALDYVQPELNQYKYLLKGLSRDTFYTNAARPFATFTNILPGTYQFQVWGSNNDGVWSQEGKGTTFFLHIPKTNQAIQSNSLAFISNYDVMDQYQHPKHPMVYDSTAEEKDRPIALIVEDHLDVLQYLILCLEDFYHIRTAADGVKGIHLALEIIPDIIVSDVMMPEKDGFELVNTLKKTMNVLVIFR